MRSAIPILICCLYALSTVEATGDNSEVQQGDANVAEPQAFWSDNKYGKGGKRDDDGDDDECASRSVSILLGTSTFAIPFMGPGNIVDLNGLLQVAFPSALPSASVVSSSTASSSDPGITDSTTTTTTTTDPTSTTTTTTTTTIIPLF
jgi:hypothetical protein